MKKGLILLFVVLMVGLTACAYGAAQLRAEEKPPCRWAEVIYGPYCYTDSLSITPPDSVDLIDWKYGQIKPNKTYVDNVYGVKFYTLDWQEVNYRYLQDGVWYWFKKTEPTSTFQIHRTANYVANITPNTYVVVAKP